MVYLFNSRYVYASVLSREGLFGNRYVLVAIAVLLPLQLLFSYAGFMQAWFGTADIDGGTWLRIVLCVTFIFFVVEGEKWLLRKRLGHA